MFQSIPSLPYKIQPSIMPFPELDQGLNLVVGLTFDLHWLWGLSGASTWHMGSQSGCVEQVMNTCEVILQVRLVWSLIHGLKDLKKGPQTIVKACIQF